MNFDQAFDALIGNEGGYSNDPLDPGGETMWGCTARVARAHGYTGAMRDLSRDTVKGWAKADYWDAAQCDSAPGSVRFDLFDTAYNSGVHEAVTLLQRAVGVEADGAFGPQTSAAAGSANPDRLVRFFNAARLEFYTSLPGWDHDGRGWTRRVAANLRR